MYRGVLIEESLGDRACLDLVSIIDRSATTIDEPAAGQLAHWTLIRFEVEDSGAAAAATAFSESLFDGPWYIDMTNGERVIVAFALVVFAYERGDDGELDRAKAHARSCGVPEGQIDWTSDSLPEANR